MLFPGGPLVRRHVIVKPGARRPILAPQLEVRFGLHLLEPHFRALGRRAAVGVIVHQRGRFGNPLVLEHGEVLHRRIPAAVRCLVVHHEKKRLRLVAAVAQPIDRLLSRDVGHVARHVVPTGSRDKRGSVVIALPRQDFPMIESGRLTHEVPFADDRRLVTGLLQQLGKRGLAAVEPALVVVEAVLVAVLAGENARPARSANRIGDIAAVKPHPLGRNPVDVRRFVAIGAIGADRLVGMIIAHDEQDVRPIIGSLHIARGRMAC